MNYKTISRQGKSLFKEKGSKFHGFAFEISDQEEVQDHLGSLRKEFHDARHHCFAYVLGLEDQQTRANDDGEPGHSAGDPILGQIRSFGLTNVIVVVIRYFGGTKLGVSGLIRAYKTAAKEALESGGVKEIFSKTDVTIEFEYEQTTQVESLIEKYDPEILSKEFSRKCTFELSARQDSFSQFSDELTKLKVTQR